MRSALLRGREHALLGTIAAIAEGRVAIAISRGGYGKQYAYVDPNEDAAAFAAGPHALLLAVADGHSGFEAAEVALEHLLDNPAAHWTEGAAPPSVEGWRRHALAALTDAALQIGAERREGSRSRTTLTLVLAVPSAGQCYYAAVGDSHLFAVSAGGAREVAAADRKSSAFLGDPTLTPKLGELSRVGTLPLAGVRSLVLATDGLSEEGIGCADPSAVVLAAARAAESESTELRPLALARAVCEEANAAHKAQHSGDNVACAVLWLADD